MEMCAELAKKFLDMGFESVEEMKDLNEIFEFNDYNTNESYENLKK